MVMNFLIVKRTTPLYNIGKTLKKAVDTMIELFLKPDDDIQSIVNQYPLDEEIQIHLEAGVYTQKCRLKHNHLKLFGSTTGVTRIENADYSYKMHPDGLLYNTFRTYTIMLLGNHVELYDIEIANTSGSGLTIGQGVALSVLSRTAFFYRCKLMGHQDTLFIGPLPVDLCERYDHFLPLEERMTFQTHHHFVECTIEGDVDFIFGSGTAYFESCNIICSSKGYIAAPSTSQSFPYGLIFERCTIISLSSHHDVYLARPWRDHGSVIFFNCVYEGKFHGNRFDPWEKSCMRFFEYPDVHSNYSLPLSEEEEERLKQYLSLHFNRSIAE
jgi:pectinesterase